VSVTQELIDRLKELDKDLRREHYVSGPNQHILDAIARLDAYEGLEAEVRRLMGTPLRGIPVAARGVNRALVFLDDLETRGEPEAPKPRKVTMAEELLLKLADADNIPARTAVLIEMQRVTPALCAALMRAAHEYYDAQQEDHPE